MSYSGKVLRRECKSTQKKMRIDWIKLVVWYIGVLISFIPVGIEAIVYLSTNSLLDEVFWLKICTKGDVLWICATLLILTLVECYSGSIELKSRVKIWLGLLTVIIWGLSLAVWAIFKYVYPNDYTGSIVFYVCGCIGGITLIVCTALQGRYVEVEK